MTATVGQRKLATKPSGVEWVGDIPEGWAVVLLRLVARIESGHTPSRSHPEYWVPSECVVPWFSLADIWQLREGKQKFLGETAEQVSQLGLANSSARILPAGTVALSRTASVGYSGIMPRPMATTQDFVNWVCGPRIQPGFLLWVFRAMKPEFDRLMRGSTHQTIYMPDVRQFRGPLPPLATQRAIAAYLDRKTAAIDALIEKKQKLLDLLAEKRAALINQAVTKGLDPNVPMKDSGVPWIGEIPAHWKVKRLKTVVTFTTSGSRGWADHYTDDESAPAFLQSGNLGRHLDVDVSECQRVRPPVGAEGERTLVEVDDVLVCITGARTGAVAVVARPIPPRAYINQHVCLARPAAGTSPAFIGLALASDLGQVHFQMVQYGGTKQGLGLDHVQNCWLAIPPFEEQKSVASKVWSRLKGILATQSAIGRHTDRLREYRQALITAAVTGQLDIGEDAA